MVFFSIYWGQEYFMNLQVSLLRLLLGGPCLLQPLCGHQCSMTVLTFCSISSAIILLWPFKEQYFFPKLWENRLFQAAFCQKCISVRKHPAGCCCYEGWSLLLNYCDFLVQKEENTQLPMISEEVFWWKPAYFPGIQPNCFHPSLTRVFSCPINFWDSPSTT